MFNISFFSENRAVYEIVCKKHATDDNTMLRKKQRYAGRITKVTTQIHTHKMQCLLLRNRLFRLTP
jgi:hypothetical protein